MTVLIAPKHFSLRKIADSGQCFRLRCIEPQIFLVRSAHMEVCVRQTPDFIEFDCPREEFESFWRSYFDLLNDYSEYNSIIYRYRDPYLMQAMVYGCGIRILRQDLFETLISFLVSQNNNIPRIKRLIEVLCAQFAGAFPNAVQMSAVSVLDLKAMGFGYRAEYIREAVRRMVTSEFDLSYLKTLNLTTSIDYLMQLPGIGPKVANCIALFGLHHLDSFPRDVWIERILKQRYDHNFNIEPYRKIAGLVQQYMFYYERGTQTASTGPKFVKNI